MAKQIYVQNLLNGNGLNYQRSPLRYPGGKFRAVETIKSMIPSGTTEIASLFFGGGSVEIACADDGVKVYGSDAFRPLVDFWREVESNSSEVARQAEKHLPLERSDFYRLQREFHKIKCKAKRAAVFFVLNRASFSGTTLSGGMSPGHPRFTKSAIERLKAFRFHNLSVRCADWKDAFDEHRDKLLYLDPPYAIQNENLYGNRGNMHNGFDHEELARRLRQKDGWILSYNDTPYIRGLYKGYDIQTPEWTYGMSKNKNSREVLIVNI